MIEKYFPDFFFQNLKLGSQKKKEKERKNKFETQRTEMNSEEIQRVSFAF